MSATAPYMDICEMLSRDNEALGTENERLQRELEFLAMERVESDEVLALRIQMQNLKAIIKRAHVSPQDSVAVSEILLEE